MKVVWMVMLALLPGLALGQSAGERALAEGEALSAEAAASQRRIEQMDDAARQALERYRQAVTQREQLLAYNERLRDMVAAQEGELESLQLQVASIEETQREVLPMIQRMVDSLEQFVALDLPFLAEERAERVTQLKELMARADVSVAEKYRRTIEAYQIESDYGRTLEAWRGTVEANGQARVVDFLRLGRLMLFYQSLDGREQGYWDPLAQRWSSLPLGYHRTLEQGLSIARQQQTPVMLKLPLPPISEPGGES